MLTNTELFEIQGTDESVTPTDAIAQVRLNGRRLSRRTVGFWQEAGLLPAAMRVGARGGVYPFIVVSLLDWIASSRDQGMKIETIRELVPVWAHLARCQGRQHVDLAVFEREVRGLGLSLEANYHVPGLVHHVMSGLCPDCLREVKWCLKDGSVVHHSEDEAVRLSFVIGEVDPESGRGHLIAWTQLTLPGIGEVPDLDDPSLVILGLPNNIEVDRPCARAVPVRRHRAKRQATCGVSKNSQEVGLF